MTPAPVILRKHRSARWAIGLWGIALSCAVTILVLVAAGEGARRTTAVEQALDRSTTTRLVNTAKACEISKRTADGVRYILLVSRSRQTDPRKRAAIDGYLKRIPAIDCEEMLRNIEKSRPR